VHFAAGELARYLEEITRLPMELVETGDQDRHFALWIGIPPVTLPSLPEVADPELDDAFSIQVSDGVGVLRGNNPRALLLGVYRFLKEIGCAWVRPGRLGERVPQKELTALNVCLEEAAALRHRGICIEGAVSEENLLEIIDWAPKAGFNSYFIQFREAYTFFERWYAHWYNPTLPKEPFGVDQARSIVGKAVEAIKLRGLLYHAVGHGWTCEPLGIPGLSWVPETYALDEKTRSFVACVNGKREIWQGIPLNTNLCYSNPEVQDLLIQSIVDYLLAHPEVNYLHFWLADDRNNQCECPECCRATPSDEYVRILNRLDEELTHRGMRTHLVFLLYFDLLWPPAVERIRNPQRFTLMFAPFTRTFTNSYPESLPAVRPIPVYQRNLLVFPEDIAENLAFLQNWQAVFTGDSFDFDYHYWRDHYNDPGDYQTAETLYRDIRHLKGIGLNGLMSCQVQRAFFPSGLGMTVMGRALWDGHADFNEIAREHFAQTFGPEGELARRYCAQLSGLFDPRYFRGELECCDDQAAERFASIRPLIQNFQPVITRNLTLPDACWAQSWCYLQLHAEMAEQLAEIGEALALGQAQLAIARWEGLRAWTHAHEEALQPVFDLYEFTTVINMNMFGIDEAG
jgi:hypothetical protein